MRAQYLRPEIQVECRDLARKMQQPSNLDEMGRKRLATFLGVRPRLIWLVKWQKSESHASNHGVRTDHAGCIRTRNSVSGCALMLGNSTVCTYCKGQAVSALSSGEAECYGLVSATSQMLGLQSVLLDWRWKFKAHVWMDAGRVKHIDAVFFWAQAVVTEGKVTLGKKPTKEMLEDFLTKHVDAELYGRTRHEVPVG